MWRYLRHLVAMEDGRERGRTISELGWRPWAPGRVVQGHGDLRSRDGRYVVGEDRLLNKYYKLAQKATQDPMLYCDRSSRAEGRGFSSDSYNI